MKKIILFILICQTSFFYHGEIMAGELNVTTGKSNENSSFKKAYFAGGCFWCMEESFDKVDGVIKSISGYSGGKLKNPTYKDVIYKDTGHVEAVEVTYDPNKISYEKLLSIFWKNIDPFDKYGQFCDKGKSYRSVIFFKNNKQKSIIQNSVAEVEQRFNSKVVTMLWKFDKFYKAEDYHQNYYNNNKNAAYCNFVIKPKIEKYLNEKK